MSMKPNDAQSSAKRTAQPGGISHSPVGGTGINIPQGGLGFRICYICYDENGERICNEIPCPNDVADQASASAPPAADAAGITTARKRKRKGPSASAERSVQGGAIDRGAVLDSPLGGPGRSIPTDVTGLAEACYMCHEHENGEMICHEITCP